jgi:triacylglycerol lipase
VRLKSLPPPSAELLLFPEHDTQYVHFEDAEHNPFDHRALDFSRVNAWWLAEAALLAYWDEAPARRIWRSAGLEFEFLSGDSFQCHIGFTGDFVVAAFRGTRLDSWHNLYDIARIEQVPWKLGGKVHEGFLDAFEHIWPAVRDTLKRLDPAGNKTWLTGHSLGAALAMLTLERLGTARGLYTIGSPPAGNRRFAKGFNARHAGRSFRYVNHHDIVVHLASWLAVFAGNYTHVKARLYIDRDGRVSTAGPTLLDRLFLGNVLDLPRQFGDAASLQLPLTGVFIDHTPRRYAVHIWNDYASARR